MMRGFSRMLACGLVASLGGCASAALLHPEAPEMNRRAPEQFVVRLETSKGLVPRHNRWAGFRSRCFLLESLEFSLGGTAIPR